MRAYRRRVPTTARPGWRDLVPALPLLAIGLVGTGRAAEQQAAWLRAPDAAAYACVTVAALALVLRVQGWRALGNLGRLVRLLLRGKIKPWRTLLGTRTPAAPGASRILGRKEAE